MKKRILFVDDEVNILRALQRMLRDARREWDMVFVESGSAALAELSAAPFDVIVTDVRMPHMTGLELLDRVSKEHPGVVRIILSGHFDQDIGLGSLRLAHQSLHKPFRQEELKATIRRAFLLKDVLASDRIKAIAAAMDRLPSLPTHYHKIIQVLSSPDASMKSIGDIISLDIAMTAKVLQVVNSAYFGLRREITTAGEAVVYMGVEQVKALVLSLQIFAFADLSGFAADFLKDLWEHSFLTGLYARAIARCRSDNRALVDAAFTAGILHDIGKIVFASNQPDEYREVAAAVREGDRFFVEVERERLLVTHTEVGAYLLSIWGLPESIVEAVLYHHDPIRCADERFSALTAVHIANHFASSRRHVGQGARIELDLPYLALLGLTDHLGELEALCLGLGRPAA